jgi:hypothetical protein
MTDDRARIVWLERALVRMLWALISAASMALGLLVYAFAVDTVGVLVAFGFGLACLLAVFFVKRIKSPIWRLDS